MSKAKDIKLKIKDHMQNLIDAGAVGSMIVTEFKKEILMQDIPKFPCVIILPPSQESVVETNRDNQDHYTFALTVVAKGEDVDSETYLEELLDAVKGELDNDPTLGGVADAGVLPSATRAEPVMEGDKSYVVFDVTIVARALRTLTF